MKGNKQKDEGELCLKKESYFLGVAKSSTLMEARPGCHSHISTGLASSKTEFLIDLHIYLE